MRLIPRIIVGFAVTGVAVGLVAVIIVTSAARFHGGPSSPGQAVTTTASPWMPASAPPAAPPPATTSPTPCAFPGHHHKNSPACAEPTPSPDSGPGGD